MQSLAAILLFASLAVKDLKTFALPVLHQTFQYDERTYDNRQPSSQTENTLPMVIISENQAASDVRSTIEEVQQLLENDKTLPRLTRGEIEELFEHVTKEEYQKSLRKGDLSRAKHMRALMVVLPYNTNENSTDNLLDLYTMPPVTKYISSDSKSPKTRPQKIVMPSGRVEIHSIRDYQEPTTYKPAFRQKSYQKYPAPTTYRPISTSPTSPLNYFQGEEFVTYKAPRIFVTPPTEDKSTVATGRYRSHYNAQNIKFEQNFGGIDRIGSFAKSEQEKSPDSETESTQELEEILESLGFPGEKSQSKKRFRLEEPPFEETESRSTVSSSIKQDQLFVDEFKPISAAITASDFTKTLGPEFKSESFTAFKPIEIRAEQARNLEPELEDYLKRFGLIQPTVDSRSQKSLRAPPIVEKTFSPPAPQKITKRVDEMIQITDDRDLKELEELLTSLKELQRLNISLTEENIKKLDLNGYNFSESLLSQGPNPLDAADSDDSAKNEVKRQTESPEPTRFNLNLNLNETSNSRKTENNGNSDSPYAAKVATEKSSVEIVTPESSDDSQSVTELKNEDVDVQNTETTEDSISAVDAGTAITTTEQSRNGAISDLEDSFGGGVDPITEEPLPPPRRTGFYFLADWNSFLEVGEDPDKVIVRFDPKVGDLSRFIPVNVP